jgi:hypothetical protein
VGGVGDTFYQRDERQGKERGVSRAESAWKREREMGRERGGASAAVDGRHRPVADGHWWAACARQAAE